MLTIKQPHRLEIENKKTWRCECYGETVDSAIHLEDFSGEKIHQCYFLMSNRLSHFGESLQNPVIEFPNSCLESWPYLLYDRWVDCTHWLIFDFRCGTLSCRIHADLMAASDPRAKNPEVFSSLSFGLSWAFGSTANIRLIKHLAEAPLQGFWFVWRWTLSTCRWFLFRTHEPKKNVPLGGLSTFFLGPILDSWTFTSATAPPSPKK